MAIPQFDGFRKKARDAEAKTNLGALYTGIKAYEFETGYVHDNLNLIGFGVEGADRYFSIGFGAITASKNYSAGTVSACTLANFKASGAACTSIQNSVPSTAKAVAAACKTLTATTFKAGTQNGGDASSDFHITQDKDLERGPCT